ncbi:MAG: T9SS type A sorting domain-containing protein [Melioribacteraceae bacterium]
MKLNLKIVTLFMVSIQLFTVIVYSQSGNAKSLEIGNKWVYKYWSHSIVYEYSYNSEEVIKDTVINNKFYAVIKTKYPSYHYERADSTKIYIYSFYNDSEYVKVNFSQKGTIVQNGYYLYADTINFWGRDRIRIRQETGTGHIEYGNSYYIEGIGLEEISIRGHGGSYSWGQYLVAAYLNGVKYGDTLRVDVNKEQQIPTHYELLQNYPNPFNPSTTIDYQIPTPGFVTLKVYDLLGREVATLVNEYKHPGNYKAKFNAGHLERSREMASGIYFYSLTAGSYSQTKKLILLK